MGGLLNRSTNKSATPGKSTQSQLRAPSGPVLLSQSEFPTRIEEDAAADGIARWHREFLMVRAQEIAGCSRQFD